MYCSRCGSWSAQEATFCWKCGNNLAQAAAPPATPPPPAYGAPAAPPPPAYGAPGDPPPSYGTPNYAPPPSTAQQGPLAWPQAPQVPHPAYQQPYAPYAPPIHQWFYLSASGLATFITVLAAINAGVYGIAAAIGLAGAVTDDRGVLDASGVVIVIGFFALLANGILLIIWTRRITGNLLPFQPALELGTRWAIFSWFIPIISYWFPLRIWNQAWRATTPTITPPIGWQWKGLPVPSTHILCWVTYHVGAIVVPFGIRTEEASTAVGYVGFAGGALIAAGMVLLILVVRNLTRRQDEYARRYLPQAPSMPNVPTGPIMRRG